MTRLFRAWALALMLLPALAPNPAGSQSLPRIAAPGSITPLQGVAYQDTDGTTVKVTPATPLPVTSGGGGGGGADGVAQNSTTAGQAGVLGQGAVTTTAPSYTTARTSPLSLTTAGDLRTVISNATLAVDTVIKGTATDRGLVVTTAGTAQQLMAANSSRRGIAVQNQSSGNCYINGTATATQDYHSLMIAPAAYYESSPAHTGTGAISIVCAVSSASVYAREF